jgi:peptidoglycan/LPS O-acetylase OafA/YrhL
MPIELIGSFLVFGFLALFGGLRNRWLLYAAAGGILFVRDQVFYLDFVLGIALCDVWVRNQRGRRLVLPAVPAVLLIALALFLVPAKPVAAVLIVGAAAAAPTVQAVLHATWLAFLGRVSFGLYLIHMPVVCSLGCGAYLALARDAGWPHTAAGIAASLISLAGSLLAAWLFYRLVDRPAIALCRGLDVWLFLAGGSGRQDAATRDEPRQAA